MTNPSRGQLKKLAGVFEVAPENIFLTGYPLPKENIGADLEIAKNDIDVEYHAAREKLMGEISSLVVAGSEKILQREVVGGL